MPFTMRPLRSATLGTAAALSLLLGAAVNAGGQQPAPPPSGAVATEVPELTRPGPWQVGTRIDQIARPAWPGLAGAAEDSVPVRLFYPATAAKGDRAVYRHEVRIARGGTIAIEEHGLAFAESIPVSGQDFPLVVISHGFGGWGEHMSRLGETLASRGYVVAAIEHGDAQFEDVAGFYASFGAVLVRRSADQRAVLQAYTTGASGRDLPIARKAKAGLVGYSMGGYGGLATAGAAYDAQAGALAGLPESVRVNLAAPAAASPALGALVLLAPWGGQPDSRMWTAQSLGKVTAPVLLISGSNDKVVNYEEGVRWMFASLGGTRRHLLTLREAGHNFAGNAIPFPMDADPRFLSYFGDPVWRPERLNQIIVHFTAAFLDRELKGDAAAASYLDVPVVDANAGVWPLPFGDVGDGAPAGPQETGYWRGFQRGWAAGLTLETKKENE